MDDNKLRNALSCLGYNINGVKLKGNIGTPSMAHKYVYIEFKDYNALVAHLETLTPPQVVEYVWSILR